MKTRLIEIEIAGPDLDDERVEKLKTAVMDLFGNLYQNHNIAVEIREKNEKTLFQPPQYPLPINQNWEKPDNTLDWWLTQPMCSCNR